MKHDDAKIAQLLASGEIWPTVWPAGISDEEFRQPLEAYQREIIRIGRKLVRLFALALDMPEDYFDDKFAVPNLIQRILYYPPQQDIPQADHLGIGAHTDYNSEKLCD